MCCPFDPIGYATAPDISPNGTLGGPMFAAIYQYMQLMFDVAWHTVRLNVKIS